MCREEMKDKKDIDNALLFSLAKLGMGKELNEFLKNQNCAAVE